MHRKIETQCGRKAVWDQIVEEIEDEFNQQRKSRVNKEVRATKYDHHLCFVTDDVTDDEDKKQRLLSCLRIYPN